ncbi:helicase HerA-like domain-containing protein [Neisseria sp. Ec49-e6-T10]|uniref:helicase HerA-like domain-containing protein n=1 Tax=Neisseria sp. Ec49-e6-T10 TaxID=3140744 RepID=UPI003EBD57FE
MASPLIIAKSSTLTDIILIPALANRHGLITGATGTGKTVTLQKMAQSFSAIGVPVFLADVKGDLSGIGAQGTMNPKLEARLKAIGIDNWQAQSCPVELWDIFAEQGHPIRATISDMGPLLLGRLLDLNEVQSGVLQLVFKIADDGNLLLLDLKDLRAMVQYIGENSKQFQTQYGNIASASIGAIQRGLLTLEDQGANQFFGEPMLDIHDLMKTNNQGQGIVNILAASKLYNTPKLYSTFLLWLLSELFEQLPEVGDLPQPKMVFFFDEAHLLFKDAPNALLDKIEHVVRLIRSKGVGIYFASQNPMDIPDNVLGQLGNRVQHALRAFTPKDQKAVKAAAQTMRANPEFDSEEAITSLSTGEALISFLDEKGSPSIVQKGSIIAPESRMGPLTAEEQNNLINHSLLYGKYEESIDRHSAFEQLTQNQTQTQNTQSANTQQPQATQTEENGFLDGLKSILFGSTGPRGGKRDGLVQTATKTMTRQLSNQIGKEIMRGILGGITGGRKKK